MERKWPQFVEWSPLLLPIGRWFFEFYLIMLFYLYLRGLKLHRQDFWNPLLLVWNRFCHPSAALPFFSVVFRIFIFIIMSFNRLIFFFKAQQFQLVLAFLNLSSFSHFLLFLFRSYITLLILIFLFSFVSILSQFSQLILLLSFHSIPVIVFLFIISLPLLFLSLIFITQLLIKLLFSLQAMLQYFPF